MHLTVEFNYTRQKIDAWPAQNIPIGFVKKNVRKRVEKKIESGNVGINLSFQDRKTHAG